MKLLSAALLAIVFSAGAALAGEAVGTWLSSDGGTKVRISNCGGKLCGTVVWLDDPNDNAGKPKTDVLNPDPAKRARPLLGLQVVQGLTPSGPNRWSGLIYNADDGKTYQAHMMVPQTNSAKVQGCVLGLLCKTENWTRTN